MDAIRTFVGNTFYAFFLFLGKKVISIVIGFDLIPFSTQKCFKM